MGVVIPPGWTPPCEQASSSRTKGFRRVGGEQVQEVGAQGGSMACRACYVH